MAAVAARVKETVVRTLTRYSMLRFGRRLGVAVSGGADSVCLLCVLAELAAEMGLRLAVLHVNHGLRGEESEGEARFVAELAGRLGLEWVEGRLEAAELRAGNMEEQARLGRMEWFGRWRRELGLDAVAVGHTRSDQAETVLMRLIRGSGPEGLAGIEPVTADRRIRPLIEVGRGEVRQWLEERGQEWREDSSNRSGALLRNRVRGELMPLLLRENPGIEGAFGRLAGLAAEDGAYWEGVERRLLEGEFVREEGAVEADAGRLGELGAAELRRVLRRAVREVRGDLRGLEWEHFEQLRRLVEERMEGVARLPGVEAVRSLGRIRMRRLGGERAGEEEIGGPGEFRLAGAGSVICLEEVGLDGERELEVFYPGYRYNGGRHLLDGDLISFPLVLRLWRPGDRLRPAGARREYSLKELFQRGRVPRWEREGWPVIVAGTRIVWARRFGVAEWAAAAPGRTRGIEVREVSSGGERSGTTGRQAQ